MSTLLSLLVLSLGGSHCQEVATLFGLQSIGVGKCLVAEELYVGGYLGHQFSHGLLILFLLDFVLN